MTKRRTQTRSDVLLPHRSQSSGTPVPSLILRRKLLAWYDRHKRDLPWRHTQDPYRVWLSESMLQQTQVATVIPYYHRFLDRFPTVRHLAESPLDDVLKLWAGLGYYARARNLHRAAQTVVSEHAGRFPDTVEGLQTLPGVGRYTAGAIASIAFDRRAPLVDGNVSRVLTRVFDISDDIADKPTQDRLWSLAESLLPARRCGDFNQALMELGATVCMPGDQPQCLLCPLRDLCGAFSAGTVADRPIKSRKTKVKAETHVVVAVESNGLYLFVRRAEGGLWGGLWELPTSVCNGESPSTAARRLAAQFSRRKIKLSREPFCDLHHQLTHRSVRFLGFRGVMLQDDMENEAAPRAMKSEAKHLNAAARKARRPTTGEILRSTQDDTVTAPADRQWLTLESTTDLGLSTAMRKVLNSLRQSVAGDESPRRPDLT